jgi:hypothetical protein
MKKRQPEWAKKILEKNPEILRSNRRLEDMIEQTKPSLPIYLDEKSTEDRRSNTD